MVDSNRQLNVAKVPYARQRAPAAGAARLRAPEAITAQVLYRLYFKHRHAAHTIVVQWCKADYSRVSVVHCDRDQRGYLWQTQVAGARA